MMSRTMRSGEIAAALGLSGATIQSYARQGRIPYRLTPGRQYRFDLGEVTEILCPSASVTPKDDLADVFSSPGPLVDALSGYRQDPIDDHVEERLRVRAFRDGRRPRAAAERPIEGDAGLLQLEAMIRRAGASAVAVLHRAGS